MRFASHLLLALIVGLPLALHADPGHKPRKSAEKMVKRLPTRELDRRVRAVLGNEATDKLHEIYQQRIDRAATSPVVAAPPPDTQPTQAPRRVSAAASVTPDPRLEATAAPPVAATQDDAAFARAVDALFAEALDKDLPQGTGRE